MNEYIDIILDRVKREYTLPPPPWHRIKGWSAVPISRQKWIQKECSAPSDFDTLRLRKRVIDQAHQSNTAVTYATCRYGEVIAIYEGDQSDEDVPWELWGRILRMYTKQQEQQEQQEQQKQKQNNPFTIYLLASTSRREFPSINEPIQPQHINGGYTYPCHNQSVVIYRAEDATRVLIHELQHASCLDHHENGIDRVEAETEAWAELLYTALLSKGIPPIWKAIWSRQWKWITSQNQRVQRHMKSPMSMEFPWRYTLGKEQVFREWFHTLPRHSSASSSSLRLTIPPTSLQKQEQNVRSTSIIL